MLKKQNTMPEINFRPNKVQTPTKTKSTKKSSSGGGGVQQWDFTKQSKEGGLGKCTKSKSMDESIDPELDAMLAELETDEVTTSTSSISVHLMNIYRSIASY